MNIVLVSLVGAGMNSIYTLFFIESSLVLDMHVNAIPTIVKIFLAAPSFLLYVFYTYNTYYYMYYTYDH